jgi:phosphoserine phosphatase
MIIGRNNRDREKPVRFRAQYPDAEITKFYSDSRSDDPMAHIAKQAFMVRGNHITPWPPA